MKSQETHNDLDNGFSPELEDLGINVIRALALDGPMRAKSGHQGTAMAMAPLAHALYTRVLRYDASDPEWPDRDRFVLSIGHASILLYSMLHLTGHGLELDDLKQFRQWESRTPGHPEAGHTAGVEVTTGPLGQGLANATGMAIAERFLRSRFGSDLCDHHVYVMAGDGDLSEGVSHETASLAGHLGLGRLIAVYDDNHVTIDGDTELALSDDAPGRFRAYGWDVVDLGEAANDVDELTAALEQAKTDEDRPTLIVVRSRIGYPSPNLTGHHSAHGNPFDADEIAATKKVMGLPEDQEFHVPDEVLAMYRAAGARGSAARYAWQQRLEASDLKDEWTSAMAGAAGGSGIAALAAASQFEPGAMVATRKASQTVLTAIAEAVPTIIGGGADLTGNTGTQIGEEAQSASNGAGRQVYFGVREHGMAAALVGAARHGGVLPIGGTFLVFSDYMRPAVRLAAMSDARCVFVWTHDSVGVGEDGPTHQPIEHIMSLRAIPRLQVIRPADAVETAGAWAMALDHDGPTALILSRQDLPVLDGTDPSKVAAGAYVVVDADDPVLVLVGTGSEVWVCVEAATKLAAEGLATRVVSMPCWSAFEALPAEDRLAVFPDGTPTVSVEAGITLGWSRYADASVGIDRFGASAPGSVALRELGITVDHVVETATSLVT
ncbi:MAG: transketolase [Acidimicrobiia bacterium]|nr:transketolase [Acidimicrobiia bacterium]